jgi:PglZ domain
VTLPVLSEQQIRSELVRFATDPGRNVLALRAQPIWSGPAAINDGGRDVSVVVAASPLAIHEALVDSAGERVVILTPCENSDLALDVRARLVGGRLATFDRWESLKGVFKAAVLDPELTNKAWLCDTLIQLAPLGGYERAANEVLDIDTAWKQFDQWCFGDGPIAPDAAAVLAAFAVPSLDRTTALERIGDDGRAALGERFAALMLPIAAMINVADVVPVGVVLGLAYAAAAPAFAATQIEARIRLETVLGNAAVTPEEALVWGGAAAKLVASADAATASRWIAQAESLLASTKASNLAEVSDLLPSGFEQRLAAAGSAITSGSVADRVNAVAAVDRHTLAVDSSERVDRLRAASRLANRLSEPLTPGALAGLANRYVNDGAWVDRVRELLAGGDAVPELASAYTALLETAGRERDRFNEQFANSVAEWSQTAPLGDSTIIPIERVLDRVVTPVANIAPVLVVVLDGMSHAAAIELLASLGADRWGLVAPAGQPAVHTVVAALPTVTEVSRASLLCGQLATGGQPEERKGFENHAGLKSASNGMLPPKLFHKSDLVGPGGLALGEKIVAAIADPRQRVVGVVVNAIDDHLTRGDQIYVSWSTTSIRPLGWILNAAAEAGRVVVMLSDHGHVLDRGSAFRPVTGDQGERWHTDVVRSGEVEIAGPRVLKGGGKIVMPFVEQLRYATPKHGYHGGITPQEVLAPCFVIARGFDIPDGFEAGWREIPTWWSGVGSPVPTAAGDVPIATPPSSKVAGVKKAVATPSLFEPAPDLAGDWIAVLLSSPLLADQLVRARRQRLDEGRLRVVLEALSRAGGSLPKPQLAERAKVPEFRLGGLLGTIKQVMNVDGYGVLTDMGDSVRLDLELLRQQFGVTPT